MAKFKPIPKKNVAAPNTPVEEAVDVIEPMKRNIVSGIALSVAKNPQWIYVRLIPQNERVLAIIPKRFAAKVTGKHINLEAITDETGTSYRYILNE
jgi:hypothetical protein